jgi:hypothetical protein
MRGARSIKKGSLFLKGMESSSHSSLSFIFLERCHLYLSCWHLEDNCVYMFVYPLHVHQQRKDC